MRIVRSWRLGALAVVAIPVAAFAADPVSIQAPTFKVGDSWVLDHSARRGANGFSRQRVAEVVDRVGSDELVVGVKPDGSPRAFEDHKIGLDLSLRLIVNDVETVTARPLSFPLKVGDSWSADWTDPRQQGAQTSAHFHTTYKVVGWEDVTVPAGAFHALKIEAKGVADSQVFLPASAGSAAVAAPGSATTVAHTQAARKEVQHVITFGTIYYAPEVKYYVKTIEEQYDASDVLVRSDTEELVSFKPGS